jgi:hypothetical protein
VFVKRLLGKIKFLIRPPEEARDRQGEVGADSFLGEDKERVNHLKLRVYS